jgi:hypothetical protein
MTSTLYCYRESKQNDYEDDHHIDRVNVQEENGEDGGVELVEHVNQYMAPHAPKIEVVSVDDQYRCNNQANSRKHSSL